MESEIQKHRMHLNVVNYEPDIFKLKQYTADVKVGDGNPHFLLWISDLQELRCLTITKFFLKLKTST